MSEVPLYQALEHFRAAAASCRLRISAEAARSANLPQPTPEAQVKSKCFTEMCGGSEEGSQLKVMDLCITQL